MKANQYDCYGNLSSVETPQGWCVRDIYEPEDIEWYNVDTEEVGRLINGSFEAKKPSIKN